MKAYETSDLTTKSVLERVSDVQTSVNDLLERIDDLVHELAILGVLEDVATETTNDNEESIL